MNAEILKERTKKFAILAINIFKNLPKTEEAKILGKQFLRSATSVASNYRAACRAKSKAEFYAKISIVVEEADESLFWLELITESGICNYSVIKDEFTEAKELLFIFSATRKTAKENLKLVSQKLSN